MAFAKSLDWIYSKITDNGYKCFRILDGANSKNTIDENMTGNLQPEQCAGAIRQTLENIEGSVVLELSIKSRGEKAAGGDVSTIKIPLSLGSAQPQTPLNGIGAATSNSFNMDAIGKILEEKDKNHALQLEAQRKEFETQRQIDDLKRKLDEDKPNPMFEKLLPVVLAAISGGQPTAIAGVKQETHTMPKETNKTDLERVNEALNKIRQVDTEWIESLEKLAELATTDPNKYNLAKSFL